MLLLSCLTFCGLMDCSLPGFSVHGILQARILEWVAIHSFRGSSDPGIEPRFSALKVDSFSLMSPGKPCICRVLGPYQISQINRVLGFLCDSAGKESTCKVGDLGSIPGLGRSPGKGNSYPLPYSGLENSMDCIVQGVAKSQTWLCDFHSLSKEWNSWNWDHRFALIGNDKGKVVAKGIND